MADFSSLRAKRVDVAVAEFNALRADIISASSAQSAFTGVGLTATGVVLGLIFQDTPVPTLGYAVPFIGALVSLIYFSFGLRMARVGTYIRTDLWPFICEELQDASLPQMPSWETEIAAQREDKRLLPQVFIFDGAMAFFFLGAAVVGMVEAWAASTLLDILSFLGLFVIAAAPLYILWEIRHLNAKPIRGHRGSHER